MLYWEQERMENKLAEKVIVTQHPMKWYQFAVYFQLFAFAVMYVIQGMMHLQGLLYGFGTAEALYAKYPTLKQVEVIMAMLGFAIAVLSVISRQLLWNFHPKAPAVYIAVISLAGCYHFIYDGLASLVIGLPIFTAYDIGGVISTVAIVLMCRRYFANRSDLFQKSEGK